jgi:murein DD-endopeptidase MepM/ murein hydrolase activator NlpD
VEPIDQPLHWRAAYRGPKPGHFHYCPGWSHFGPVRPNGKWHRGFDLAASTGTPVHAAVAGALSYARDPNGWGLFARLRFKAPVKSASGACEAGEELELLYAHLTDDTPSLVMGQEKEVASGAVVGRVGCSGNARGMCSPSPESHVHVTLRTVKDHKQVDPGPLVGWAVRTAEQGALDPCP